MYITLQPSPEPQPLKPNGQAVQYHEPLAVPFPTTQRVCGSQRPPPPLGAMLPSHHGRLRSCSTAAKPFLSSRCWRAKSFGDAVSPTIATEPFGSSATPRTEDTTGSTAAAAATRSLLLVAARLPAGKAIHATKPSCPVPFGFGSCALGGRCSWSTDEGQSSVLRRRSSAAPGKRRSLSEYCRRPLAPALASALAAAAPAAPHLRAAAQQQPRRQAAVLARGQQRRRVAAESREVR